MAKALIVPPSGLPVSLEAIKAHLRVESGDEDDYVADLALAASAHVESHCGICLLSQTWRHYRDEFPADGRMTIEARPLQSVVSVIVYDAQGQPQTVDPQSYTLDRFANPARLHFSGIVPPGKAPNGVEIDIVCGFGDTGADVPDEIKRAILVLVAHWHSMRGSAADAAKTGLVPDGFDRLTAPWRGVRL